MNRGQWMHKIQNDTCSCNRQDYSNVNVECFQNEGWKLEQPRRLTEPGLDTVHVVSDIHRLFKKFGKPPHSSTDKESASLFFRASACNHSIRSHSVKFRMRVDDKSPRKSLASTTICGTYRLVKQIATFNRSKRSFDIEAKSNCNLWLKPEG